MAKASFNWIDPLLLDQQLTEEERMVRDSAQQFANDKLRSQGYLFLNDVYEMLGFPLVPEGQVVGWVLDESNASYSENVIDFGIWDMHSVENVAFINGEEKAVVLDFNVDGVIYDTFPKYSRT